MILSRFYIFLIFLLSTLQIDVHAQSDSISSLTITEFQDDTVYWQDLIIQNFYDKLIFELKKFGLGRDDTDVEMTTYFYDWYGNLAKSIKIEEDRNECFSEWTSEWNSEFPSVTTFVPEFIYLPLDTNNDGTNHIMIPDSIPGSSKFCGRYFTKTTYYLPYTIVTNSLSYYDDGDTTYSIDSLFSDRYGDDIRKVTYVNDKKHLEYRYNYVRDRQGRIIARKWDNLTSGEEFLLKDEYVYNGNEKLQTFHSSHFLSKGTKKYSSKIVYDEEFEMVKSETYLGDSLTSSTYSNHKDDVYRSVTVNSSGDTTNLTEYALKQSKRKKETWSHESRTPREYYYTVIDTIRKKGGYCIESHKYSVTKEQFLEREDTMNKRNRIRYKNLKYFNKLGHLVRELEYDGDELESEFTYEYKTVN